MSRHFFYDIIVFSIIIALLLFLEIPFLNITLCFIIVLIYAYNQKGFKIELGFKKPKNITNTILLSLGFAIGIVLISYFVLFTPIEKLTGYPINLGPFGAIKNNTSVLISSLALGWLVGGFMEETIFRGFMVSKFINHLPNKVGAVIGAVLTSVIFGYLHAYQGPTGQILIGIMGLFLASIFILSKRNLWLNILTHGFVNTISMLLLYFDVYKT